MRPAKAGPSSLPSIPPPAPGPYPPLRPPTPHPRGTLGLPGAAGGKGRGRKLFCLK